MHKLQFESFCSASQPTKNIVKALHSEIRLSSYGVGRLCHTVALGSCLNTSFRYVSKSVVKPIILLAQFVVINYINECSQDLIIVVSL